MAIRPDLLQELGNTTQPIIIKDFEDSANAKDVVDACVRVIKKKGFEFE